MTVCFKLLLLALTLALAVMFRMKKMHVYCGSKWLRGHRGFVVFGKRCVSSVDVKAGSLLFDLSKHLKTIRHFLTSGRLLLFS